jgi:hypothetical protein
VKTNCNAFDIGCRAAIESSLASSGVPSQKRQLAEVADVAVYAGSAFAGALAWLIQAYTHEDKTPPKNIHMPWAPITEVPQALATSVFAIKPPSGLPMVSITHTPEPTRFLGDTPPSTTTVASSGEVLIILSKELADRIQQEIKKAANANCPEAHKVFDKSKILRRQSSAGFAAAVLCGSLAVGRLAQPGLIFEDLRVFLRGINRMNLNLGVNNFAQAMNAVFDTMRNELVIPTDIQQQAAAVAVVMLMELVIDLVYQVVMDHVSIQTTNTVSKSRLETDSATTSSSSSSSTSSKKPCPTDSLESNSVRSMLFLSCSMLTTTSRTAMIPIVVVEI